MPVRSLLIILDSVGIGAAPDAVQFGTIDLQADTLWHVRAAWIPMDGRPLPLPTLDRWGLTAAWSSAHGRHIPSTPLDTHHACAALAERGVAKDTTSGHWEMLGAAVLEPWGRFERDADSVPDDLLAELARLGAVPGFLGNVRGSGTEILSRWAEESVRTGRPIVYTSGDSVLQIAADEEHFGLDRLLSLATHARRLVDPLRIARVITRPFVRAGNGWRRTGHRHDLSMPPPSPLLTERLVAHGVAVHGIGKIPDILAHRGISMTHVADGLTAQCDAILGAWEHCRTEGGCVIANLSDFDTLYGHRRDPYGYGDALATFDRWLAVLESTLDPGHDLVIITADHGNDPTLPGSDHTREWVPLLSFGGDIQTGCHGQRHGFGVVGASLARWHHAPWDGPEVPLPREHPHPPV